MAGESSPRDRSGIRYGRRDFPVLDRLRIRGRTYLLLERLGRAGRERYFAWDPAAGPRGEPRAVLTVPRTEAGSRQARVLQELSRRNESAPRMFDYQADGERLTLVVDWIRGQPLDEYLAVLDAGRRPPISVYESVRLIRGLAHGLHRLHQHAGVVHGDIAPRNLILAQDRKRLVAIDYGNAWYAPRTIGRDPGDGLCPFHAAPERQNGAEFVDCRADQFSASVVLYRLLTGRLPYDGLGGKAGRPGSVQRLRHALVPPTQLLTTREPLPRTIRDRLDRVAATGLALDPQARYDTATAWLAALDDLFAALQRPETLSPLARALTRLVGWLDRGRHAR